VGFEVGIGPAWNEGSVCRRAAPAGGPTREAVTALLHGSALETFLQPIVRLEDGSLAGFEALGRGPLGTPLREADPLFEAARDLGLSPEVELAFFRLACGWLPNLPKACFLSVNLGPELIQGPELRALLGEPALAAQRDRLVLELTEHLPLESLGALREALAQLGDPPPRLSLDDTGCGFFDLNTVEALRPGIVKLCITVVSRLERSEDVVRETREVIARVRALGGEVLGEGVETAAQAEILRRCGATYAQGFHFGRPQPASEVVGARVGSA
jgi:EAL domain-containing protein (putative c-di-GMP-specific phosphodiesterase class I)